MMPMKTLSNFYASELEGNAFVLVKILSLW